MTSFPESSTSPVTAAFSTLFGAFSSVSGTLDLARIERLLLNILCQ